MPGDLTVIIADDHPLFRKGVADVLRADAALRLVGEASDGDEALHLIRTQRPRVAVLDVEMPKRSGLDVIMAVAAEKLSVGLVLLTMYADRDMLQRALELGVRGYVSKESAAEEIISCVHLVASGRTYISAALASPVATTHRLGAPDLATLTPSERNVLSRIAHNMTTRAIADELGVSSKTVENHRSNICQKLGITGNNALMRFVIEHAGALAELPG